MEMSTRTHHCWFVADEVTVVADRDGYTPSAIHLTLTNSDETVLFSLSDGQATDVIAALAAVTHEAEAAS